ncbi:MAG TPA: MarR family transcriptional regulator [Acidimicrobiales bacterium]|nr:MarR family transcriptional regulator [Acidimicrobiales bacterium]
MVSLSGIELERSRQIDVAGQLLARAAALARLVAKQVGGELSRTEANILNTLTFGPRRITELAEFEGLAQPTTTLLVKRLEDRGWVRRERQNYDGRIVMVSVTTVGAETLEIYRSQFGEALRADLAETATDEEIASLISATATLESLIVHLQSRRR